MLGIVTDGPVGRPPGEAAAYEVLEQRPAGWQPGSRIRKARVEVLDRQRDRHHPRVDRAAPARNGPSQLVIQCGNLSPTGLAHGANTVTPGDHLAAFD